jgi:ureidoacrylate peracid hydrolase
MNMTVNTRSHSLDGVVLNLEAQPEAIQFQASETALIVVDMQNAYASKGGYLDLAGFDVSGAAAVIDKIQLAIAAAHYAGIQVVYLQNGWDRAYTPNWHKSNALKTMRRRPELEGNLLAKGTWDYELVSGLKPTKNDFVVEKPRYSGFFNTALDSALRARGIHHIVLTGIATNVCVESTLRDGFFLEYFGTVLEDATHQAGPEFVQKATMYNIETFFGWVSNVQAFCRAVGYQSSIGAATHA